MSAHSRKYAIMSLLLLWFFLWGICPWDSSSAAAQPLEAAHTQHGHHGTDDTHHASKGSEHSCSGSILYSNEKSVEGKGCLKPVATKRFSALIVLQSDLYQPYHLSLSLSQTPQLPKRFSNLYQFNPTLRI